jgi:phosphoglucosamine mutase
MARIFGTDGVRGVANKELTVELAMNLGKAGAYVLTKENAHKPTILVGCDTRISGEMLANALMAGVCAVGANAVYAGVVPTPAIAYLTRKYNYDAGVVISASHNPAEYNGIKFFSKTGYKLSDRLEDEIEETLRMNSSELPMPLGDEVGKISYNYDLKDDYVDFAASLIDMDLSGLKIVLDTAEGAAYYTAESTLRKLGAEPIVIHNNPDGININRGCGSTHMEELREKVLEVGADIGIAFDGDADRMLAVDEKGNMIDGDQIMAICGLYMKNKGILKNDTIVATVMSNLGFFQMGVRENIHIEQTKVGDRYVLECMLKEGYNLGGEQSGHVIFLDENTTGDGLISALHLLQVVVESGKKVSELASVMTILPQALVNAKVSNRKKEYYMDNKNIADAIADFEKRFAGAGRVLIRPSGTEPLIRVMIEGNDQDFIDREAKALAKLIEDNIGE